MKSNNQNQLEKRNQRINTHTVTEKDTYKFYIEFLTLDILYNLKSIIFPIIFQERIEKRYSSLWYYYVFNR